MGNQGGRKRLSKSRVMAGLQCMKRLFLEINHPELANDVSASQQAIFDQGNLVGSQAQKHFPNGRLIDAKHFEVDKALKQTEEAIESGANVLYEAAFVHSDILVRIDILHRESKKSSWNITEVKSSTSVQEQHIQDAAIQAFVLEGSGKSVESVSVMTINNECVFPHLKNLFNSTDVTDEVPKTIKILPSVLKAFDSVLAGAEPPEQDIGPHCSDPYNCAFLEHCRSEKKIPELSVFDIPGLNSKAKWKLYQQGKISLADVHKEDIKLNAIQLKMIEVSLSGKRHTNGPEIAKALSEWAYPLYFLDFESIGPAIPMYEGTRPYQQIPFQFSCHIQMEPGGVILHQEYLHDSPSDPRRPLVEALLSAVGESGSVVSYYKSFENARIVELADFFPEYRNSLLAVSERLVDPLPIIRANVYDKQFFGSFSIKDVAPALLGSELSYDGMVVSNGTEAQIAFEKLISSDIDVSQRATVRTAMLEYCRKDTIAMVNLVEWLRTQARVLGVSAAD